MMNDYFKKYKSSKEGFDKFHNEVINMPRDSFSNVGYDHIRLIAKYLKFFHLGNQGIQYYTYKEIYSYLLEEFKNNNLSINDNFESQYFAPFVNMDTNQAYSDDGIGRMFRHNMGIASFFELIHSESRTKKRVNIEKCNEFLLTPKNLLDDLKRNTILSVQVNKNSFIKGLAGVHKYATTDYEPSYAILEYINKINRPVTPFEISILLGRIDELNEPDQILERALKIGSKFPNTQEEQIKYFFNKMEWKNKEGKYFTYSSSQQPYFKFKVFYLYMEEFGLLKNVGNSYILTEYSKKMINEDIDPYLFDLDNLLAKIDNFDRPHEIENIVLNSRTLELDHLLETKDDLITKLGLRSIRENEAYLKHSKEKHSKSQRNRLVMFFAKHLGRHTCKVVTNFTKNGPTYLYDVPTFETGNDRYYSEGHHILELSADNGPDVIENIILVDPNTHKLIHNASQNQVYDLYDTLRRDDILSIDRFENMIKRYNCLNDNHLEILKTKKIIDDSGYIYLKTLLDTSPLN